MASYGQSITIAYQAWNTSTNAPQTGDASNQTIKLLKDGTEATATNAPTEIDSTNAKGMYSLVLTTAECQHNCVVVMGVSSTSSVYLQPVVITFEQLPTAVAGAAGGLLIAGTNAATTFGPLQINSGGVTLTNLQVNTGSVTLASEQINTGSVTLASEQINSGAYTLSAFNVTSSSLSTLVVSAGSMTLGTYHVNGIFQIDAGNITLTTINSIITTLSTLQVNGGGFTAGNLQVNSGNVTIAAMNVTTETVATLQINGGGETRTNFQVNSGNVTLSGANVTTMTLSTLQVNGGGFTLGNQQINSGNVTESFTNSTFPSVTASSATVTFVNAPTAGTLNLGQLTVGSGTMTLGGVNITTATLGDFQVNSGGITATFNGSLTGSVGSISGVTFPSGFSGLTSAAIATAVMTDTGDQSTHASLGWMVAVYINGLNAPTSATSPLSAAFLALAPSGGGGGPTADQIAQEVWETTSNYFGVAGSPGSVLVKQLGGGFTNNTGSTLTTVMLQNTPTGGGGSGANTVTAVAVNANTSATLAGVSIAFLSGSSVDGLLTTNSGGTAVFSLNNGTYQVNAAANAGGYLGYTSNGYSVPPGGPIVIPLTPSPTPTPATQPGTTTGYCTTDNGQGVIEEGVQFWFQFVGPISQTAGLSNSNTWFTSDFNPPYSNSLGLFQITLQQLANYRFYRGPEGCGSPVYNMQTGSGTTTLIPYNLGSDT